MIPALLACATTEPAPAPAPVSTVPLPPPTWTLEPDLEFGELLLPVAGEVVARVAEDYGSWENVDLLHELAVVHSADPAGNSGNHYRVEGRIDGTDLLDLGSASVNEDVWLSRRTGQQWSDFLLSGWADHTGCCMEGDIGDLTGDAIDDVVFPALLGDLTESPSQATTWILAGPIDATHDAEWFAAFPGGGDLTVPHQPRVADWTGDGEPDLALACGRPTVAFVLGPIAEGTVTPCMEIPDVVDLSAYEFSGSLYSWLPMSHTAAGDFDGDGYPDVAQTLLGEDYTLPLAAWSGPFTGVRSREATLFRIDLVPIVKGGPQMAHVSWLTAGDLNDDAIDDLVLEWNGYEDTRLGFDKVRVAYGPLVGAVAYDSQAWVHRPELGAATINLDDIDLDGDDDLVMGMLEDTPFDGIEYLEGPLTAVFFGPVQF